MTLISAPVARKSVEYEWRNVCQPIRRLIPSFTAVGRMTYLALRALPHEANGVHAAEAMTDRVIE
jgi:hypothetical protein